MNPQAPNRGYRAGLVFHYSYKNCIVPVTRFYYILDSPLQYPFLDFTRKPDNCDLPIDGIHPPVPLKKKGGITTPVAEFRGFRGTIHNLHAMLQRWTKKGPPHPHTLEVLRADLIHPRCLATVELANYLNGFSFGDGWVNLSVSNLCFLNERCVCVFEEILKVSLEHTEGTSNRL